MDVKWDWVMALGCALTRADLETTMKATAHGI